MTYSEKLKDPRWQKKRLEIMQRDEFTCSVCGDTESPLVIHHYKYDGEPWEVDDEYLATMCWNCHEEEHTLIEAARKQLKELTCAMDSETLININYFIYRLAEESNLPLFVSSDALQYIDIQEMIKNCLEIRKEKNRSKNERK